MRSSALILSIIVGLLAAAVAGCGAQPEQDVTVLEGTTWMAVAMQAASGLEPVEADVATTAKFSDGVLGGNGGVNRYSGSYEASADGSMNVEMGASTAMAGPEPAMAQEARFFELLPKTDAFVVTPDSLELMDGQGEVLVRFEAVVNKPLEGTAWTCTSYNNGKGAVVTVISGSEITALFEGGRVEGSAGVNRYNGSFETSGDELRIGPLATTKMAGPQKLMDQEAQYLRALEGATRFSVEGDSLVVYGQNDAVAATYIAE